MEIDTLTSNLTARIEERLREDRKEIRDTRRKVGRLAGVRVSDNWVGDSEVGVG